MTYTEADASSTNAAIDKYRGDLTGEVGAAIAVVGLCSERVLKEAAIRDDMVRVVTSRSVVAAACRSIRLGPEDHHRDRRG